MLLENRVAVVTGAGRGIGRQFALELAAQGAAVVVNDLGVSLRGDAEAEDPATSVCREIEASGGRAVPSHESVSDFEAAGRIVATAVDTYGRIDILVNNAGGTVPAPHVEDIPELVQKIQGAPRSADDFERTVLYHSFAIQMNLISPLWFAIRVYRQMATQDGTGSIINISSGAGHPAGAPTLVSYGAAKSGLNHMTRSLAEEWGPKARVNCLALGPTMTDNFQAFVLPADDPDGREYFANLPLGRAGEPDEVGRACVFLCSGEADFINGTTIEIDGGMLPGVLYAAGLKTITDLL